MPTKEATDTILMIKDVIIKFFVEYGFKLFGGMVILIIGILIARYIGKIVLRQLSKKDMEPPVRMLIVRVIKLVIIAFTFVLVLEKVGVAIAPLVAGIGVAGVGIGLAMQGVLGNIVAGLTIIFTKPFRVGEYIELLSVNGQVTNIELFSTTLVHADRSRVVIPNRKIVGEILHNYGTARQLNLSVGVAYGTNMTEAIAMVKDILARNPRVLKNLEPVVGTSELGDSAVSITIRPWVSVPDYGPASAEINLAVLERFRAARIEIPFPQREVRLLNSAAA